MRGAPPTLDEVCERAAQLPCAPALLPRLMLALRDEGSTVGDFGGIIALDSALAAATLRLANSAHYAGAGRARTVEEAVLRLGQREIYRLAAMVLIARWEPVHLDNLRWSPGDYARHSVCTALSAEVLAEVSERVDPPLAYAAGLVCDVGKLALAYACPAFYPSVSLRCRTNPCTWEQAERAIFGFHHAEVGARLLRQWSFPELFAEAIERQFDPERAPGEALPLVAHLHAARFLAVSLGPGVTEDGFLFALHGPFLAEWGFTQDLLEEAMVEVRDRALVRLGERLHQGPVR